MQRGFFVVGGNTMNLRINKQVIIIAGEKKHFVGKIVKMDENTVDVELNYNGETVTKNIDEIQIYNNQVTPIEMFLDGYSRNEIVGLSTRELYGDFREYCEENDIDIMSNTEFTKQVNEILNLTVIEKRIDGRKFRIFSEV